MKTLVFTLAAFISFAGFQMMEKNPVGKYVLNDQESVVIKKDKTFLETHGSDWRNGMWKVSHDTVILQDGMTHSGSAGRQYPNYRPVYMIKGADLMVGKDLYKRAKTETPPAKAPVKK